MARTSRPDPSASEWKVLRYVWERGTSTAGEVAEALSAREGWSASTVKTLLRRLAEKGHVKTRRRGASLLYSAKRSTREALFEAADTLLERAREDTVGPLLQHLVKRSSLSSHELAALKRLVEDEERRRSR